jgi:hypothetical protein
MHTFFTRVSAEAMKAAEASASSASSFIIGHTAMPHCGESLLQRLKLRKECRINVLGRLVPLQSSLRKDSMT